jgi:hypothetical protein
MIMVLFGVTLGIIILAGAVIGGRYYYKRRLAEKRGTKVWTWNKRLDQAVQLDQVG